MLGRARLPGSSRRAIAGDGARSGCSGPKGICLGSSAPPRSREPIYTKYVVVDETTLRYRTYPGAAPPPAQPAQRRHHQAVQAPSRHRLFLDEEQGARNAVPQAGAANLRDGSDGPTHRRIPQRFRHRDHYAGTLKAVVLSVCPDATLVDIGHEIPAHDVLAGALELAACYKYFPKARSSSSWWIPASVRRDAASPPTPATTVRRARQRRAVGGVRRSAAEARRRTDRAQVRARHREPHVRRPRSIRAGGRWLAKGINITWLGKTITDFHTIACRGRRSRAMRFTAKSCASIASAT